MDLKEQFEKETGNDPWFEDDKTGLMGLTQDYVDWLESKLNNNEVLDPVSNPLPTKEEVIAEGDKQIEDWLSENHYKEQRAYRVAFRRSFEYVLRFIK